MAVQFREKALMAYETMPMNQKSKVSQVIEQLDTTNSHPLDSYKLKSPALDAWVVRVDQGVRLLFTKTDQGFLIIDIVNRNKEDNS